MFPLSMSLLMDKLVLLLKFTDNNDLIESFMTKIPGYLSSFAGKEIKAGIVEGDILSGSKYIRLCEVEAESQDAIQRFLQTSEGRQLNIEISGFNELIVPLFVKY